jgi:hypothetical protein
VPSPNYALGQLVFYRTKSQYKPELDPNAFPALMAGWKLEFGLRYKGVLIVLDYAALREGKKLCVSKCRTKKFTLVIPFLFLLRMPLKEAFCQEILDSQEPFPIFLMRILQT